MKFKKTMAMVLAAICAVGVVSGCAGSKKGDGKIDVSIGAWPNEMDQTGLEKRNKIKDEFMAENPDINIIGDTYNYDTKTFTMKASANQLPNAFKTWLTEVQQIIKQGYAADVTDAIKAHGFDKSLNPELLKWVTGEDGKYYALPTDAYVLGFYLNKDLYKEAGLVNEDGSLKVPDTWQEVAENAKIIKDKTGKAGFGFPTTNNHGGWMFLNIAWGFGVEFEKQREDGTWEATFDTQEARNALQFIKDLRWKYDVLLPDTVMTQDDVTKYFGTEQVAMTIADVPYGSWALGTDNSKWSAIKMPKGDAGRFAQMGGNLWMFSKNSTPEQIEAAFNWIEYNGFTPNLTDAMKENLRTNYKTVVEKGGVVLDRESYDVWTLPEAVEERRAIRREFVNVDPDDYSSYFDATDLQVNLEPKACCQQLYAVLDKCIQEVITNENADVDKLISEACEDFQVNHLDKM